MLCIKVKGDPKKIVQNFTDEGVIIDFREPNILRIAPAPLYNSFEDVYRLVGVIKNALYN